MTDDTTEINKQNWT